MKKSVYIERYNEFTFLPNIDHEAYLQYSLKINFFSFLQSSYIFEKEKPRGNWKDRGRCMNVIGEKANYVHL